MNTTYINKPDILKWYIHKILLIMRLTTAIFMVSMLQVSASTVAQEFNYVKNGVSLIQIFKEIKKQTGYNIVWKEKKIDVSTTIDANFKKATIDDVLNRCLSNLCLCYSIKDKLVTIKETEPSFRKKLADFFNFIDVRGRVVDQNNQPLPKATVKVKNSTRSTLTDGKGYFTLSNIADEAVLVISYIGYDTKEVKASGNLGSISLILSTGKLKEVEINTGYYTVKDKERTGSISRITSAEIERQPINNVLQAMQANIPGIQIIQNTGVPGGSFSVRIRGQNSLKQGNEPFYIIDGIPFTATSIAGTRSLSITPGANPLATINPADIASIEVLKDADATAIYGSRGANGVILITTKRGKTEKAKTSIVLNQGMSRVGKKIALMNTDQYTAMRKEAIANDELVISTTDYDLNGTWGSDRNTDWQEELIGGIAPRTNISASLAADSKNMTYLIGGTYYKEGTVFPGEGSYGRNSGNFSLQYTSDNKKMNLSFSANYSQINSNLFTQDLTSFITLAPNYPALTDENGLLNWADNTMYANPFANIQRPYDAKTSNLITYAMLDYIIIPDFKVKAGFGYTIMNREEVTSDPLTSFSPAFNYGSLQRISNFADNSMNTWIFETQADYIRKIGNGKLNILIGSTLQESLTDNQDVRATGYTSDALMGNIAAASILTISDRSYLQYRYTAVFSRLNYTFKEKYVINATGRRDGSSRFGSENRFANFGAIGIAWIMSGEKFVKTTLPFVSFAKLRGSYGITGNDQIQDYRYLELWRSFSTYQGISTISPTSLANPNYAWEVNKKMEAALELGFIKNKINLSVGYYNNRSSNQLLGKRLPPSTGFQSIQDNLPATIGNAGWELDINTKNISTKTFSWTTSINLTVPKNKLIAYPNLETSGFDATQYVVGQPISIKKLYNTNVNPQTGLYIREDYDKNGVVDTKDQYIIAFNGRKFYGGLQNSFSYKGVVLDILFQFVKQTGNGYLTTFDLPGRFQATSPMTNQINVVNDRWLSHGDVSFYQKYSTSSAARTSYLEGTTSGDLAVNDASFIRLNNISLSYSLPSQFLQKVKLYNAKFFLQGQNLFTLTPYKGLDPETQSSVRLPILQTFTGGIQLTL